MEISVIFPAYNEAETIRPTMAKALDALRSVVDRFEILIVDDCGQDGTGRIADELAARHPEIRAIHNVANIGQGASIVRGFEEARFDLVTHNAMDYPFDLRDLNQLLPQLKEADIVVGSRLSRPGYSPYRMIMSYVNLMLLHTLFPLRLKDYNFVQLYPKSVWKSVKVEARSTAFLTPEALIRAFDMGYRIKEIGIPYHPRLAGEATAGRPKVILRSLQDMLRFWWKRQRGRTPRGFRKESLC
jgi:dolichol-phosphate mannosyltransferase